MPPGARPQGHAPFGCARASTPVRARALCDRPLGLDAAGSFTFVRRRSSCGPRPRAAISLSSSISGSRLPESRGWRHPPTASASQRACNIAVGATLSPGKNAQRNRRPNLGPANDRDDERRAVNDLGTAVDGADQRLEVMWQPEIVVAEVGDQLATGQPDTLVVGPGLVPGVARPGCATAPAGRRPGHDLRRLVGAAVADHEQLEVGERLVEDAADRVRQDRGPVVGRR